MVSANIRILLVAQLLATCTCFYIPWWRHAIDKGRSPWGRSAVPNKRGIHPGERGIYPGEQCECVPNYNCDASSRRIITDGSNGIDFRQKNPCLKDDEVCCFYPKDDSDEEKDYNSVRPPTTKTSTGPPSSLDSVEEKENISLQPSSEAPPPGSRGSSVNCGERNPRFRLTPKVAGDDDDTETVEGEFPWALLLQYIEPASDGDEEPFRLMLCGASLIHPQAAITAAHCVEGKNIEQLNLRAGEYDLNSNDERIKVQDRRVTKVIKHPKYSHNPIALRNDIAILIVDIPFELNEATNTICLPNGKDNIKWKNCVAVGWGANKEREMREDQIMRQAAMDIVPRDTCLKQLRQTKLGKLFRLHKSFLCAGGQTDADTCFGDGGGPYSCSDDNGRFYQVGVTSWGVDGCQNKNVPGGYTDVAYMYDWIVDSMTTLNLYE